jgi:glucose/arabinose dehydrogenase
MLATVIAAAALVAPVSARQHHQFSFRPLASGLEGLTSIASTSAEPGRFYATTKRGRVLIFKHGRRLGVFLNIEDEVQSAAAEQGLLSLAFHPNYRRNHRFYVDYTDFRGDTRVVEFRSRNGRAIRSSARLLLFVKQPEANHNGGELQFDRNGLLYVGMGDGGEPGDPNNRAQSMSDRLGKILRLDPLRSGAGWQVAGLGLRNPWRFSFDRKNGDLYIADVGTDRWEEIDYRSRAQVSTLANYGWRLFEGPDPRFPDSTRGPGELLTPIHAYNHESGNCTIIGGYVYRGKAVPAARGRYFFGDYCSGSVWSLRVRDGRAADVRSEGFHVPGLTSFGEDARGELYLATDTGRILQLKK